MDRFGRHLRQEAPAPTPVVEQPIEQPTPVAEPAFSVADLGLIAEQHSAEETNVTSGSLLGGLKERVSNATSSIKERYSRVGRRIRYASVVAIAAAGVYVAAEAFSTGDQAPVKANADNTPGKLAADFNNQPNCKDFALNDVSSNPNLYTAKAFLPKIGENESAADYVNGLFAKDGTLVNDGHSLAAVMATIVEPALASNINDPNYSYVDTYHNKLAAYEANGGQAVAARDCETAYAVMSQIANNNDDWAGRGDHISMFAADRSDKYRIDGATLTKPWVVQANKLSGIEFELTQTAKGVNGQQLEGFPSVLILPNGEMIVKGLKPTDAGSSMQETGHKQHQKKQHNQHNHHKNNKGTEQGQVSTGSAGGSTGTTTETQASNATSTTSAGSNEGQGGNPSNGTFGTSKNNGESDVPGPVKEQGPGSTAGSGGQTGHQPGPAKSFGGGGGGEGTPAPAPGPAPGPAPSPTPGGGEGTPPTTTPPVETPPTTPPPTTTPPTTPPPTTTPPTTPPPTPPVVKPGDPGQGGA